MKMSLKCVFAYRNDFAQLVGEEYLKHFDFKSQSLDAALRSFLQHLVLSGETQERERILVHFSHRFLECNSGSFSSEGKLLSYYNKLKISVPSLLCTIGVSQQPVQVKSQLRVVVADCVMLWLIVGCFS